MEWDVLYDIVTDINNARMRQKSADRLGDLFNALYLLLDTHFDAKSYTRVGDDDLARMGRDSTVCDKLSGLLDQTFELLLGRPSQRLAGYAGSRRAELRRPCQHPGPMVRGNGGRRGLPTERTFVPAP